MSIWEWFLQHRREPHPAARAGAGGRPASRPRLLGAPHAGRATDGLPRGGRRGDRPEPASASTRGTSPRPTFALARWSTRRSRSRCVWNGVVRSLTARDGRLELRAEGRTPAALEKTDELAGPLDDAVGTPFAVVLGTTSRDPGCGAPADVEAPRPQPSWSPGRPAEGEAAGLRGHRRSRTPTPPATRCCSCGGPA